MRQFFAAERRAGHVRILTKEPLRPGDEEVAANARPANEFAATRAPSRPAATPQLLTETAEESVSPPFD